MSGWDNGYYTQSGYTFGYYRELSPVYQRFCLLLRGFSAPAPGRDAVHCELGFGQGVSAAIHAAANPGTYIGTDFNPVHAAGAREMAQASGANARFFDESFGEFLERGDLPPCDSISLHGIWSWVSPENRDEITAIARRLLKPGGIFYNSYNCLPGWAPFAPLRELFVLGDAEAGPGASAKERVDSMLAFAKNLLDANPMYAANVPDLGARLESIGKKSKSYLCHEYLNRHWHLAYFADVARMMADNAKLDFACTAEPLDYNDNFHLDEKAIGFLNGIKNAIFREQARDYFVNRQFRKDLYVRGLRPLSDTARRKLLLDLRVVLLKDPGSIEMSINVTRGKADLNEKVYRPFLEWLAGEGGSPKRLGDYKDTPQMKTAFLEELLRTLASKNDISPCQTENEVDIVRGRCRALNDWLCRQALTGGKISWLTSPETGGAVDVGPFEMMFLHFMTDRGTTAPAELAKLSWDVLNGRGSKIVKEGKTLQTEEENLTELESLARGFCDIRLPILKALGVA